MYFWASDRTIGYFLNKGAHLSIFLLATLSKLFDFKLEFFKNKFKCRIHSMWINSVLLIFKKPYHVC